MNRLDGSLFVGNGRTLQRVEDMLMQKRVPQALVIEGPAGSGKKTLARLIAAGLLCGEPSPCGTCNVCSLIAKDAHPDVTWVRSEKDKSSLSVGEIRDVRAEAYMPPQQSDRKVFVIADEMNVQAQNALLKVLEEPPAHVVFLILCEHHSNLIATVQSRVTVFTLGSVSYDEALPVLLGHGFSDSPATRHRYETGGQVIGSMLQAGEEPTEEWRAAEGCALALARGKREEFLQAVAPIMGERALYPGTLTALYTLIRDGLVCLVGQSGGEEIPALLSRRLSREQLLQAAQVIAEYQENLPYNPNGGLFFTALCARLFPRQ